MWFPNRSDTNRAVQAQKMARGWIKKVEDLYYLYSENKGDDQLHSYSETDLRLRNVGFPMVLFYACKQNWLVIKYVYHYIVQKAD